MLTGFSCSGYGGSLLFRHGRTTLPAYREHLLYRVTSTEQGKPVSLPARGRSTVRWIDGGAGIGIARKRTLPCNRADRGCVASMGQDDLTGNGANFVMVCQTREHCGTDVGSKANDGLAQAAVQSSHTDGGFFTAVRVGRRSDREGFICCLNKAENLFQGGVIECSSRMTGSCSVRLREGWPRWGPVRLGA